MNVRTSTEVECWEADVLVAAARLIPVTAVWFLALSIIDDPTSARPSVFALNFRLAFWLYVAETAYRICRSSYCMPLGMPRDRKLAIAASEAWSFLRRGAWRAPVSMMVRWVSVAGLTAIALVLFGQNSVLTSLVSFIPTIVALLFSRKLIPSIFDDPEPGLIRGTHISTLQEVQPRAATALAAYKTRAAEAAALAVREGRPVPVGVRPIPWGGIDVFLDGKAPSFLIVGSTGSGKTLMTRTLIKAALPKCDCRPASRALIYDPKKEFYSELVAAGVSANDIFVLNPNDARSAAWDMSADITSKDDADNLAAILVPDTPGSKENTFFNDALRALTSAVIESLQNSKPGNWGLIDILDCMRSPSHLKAAMANAPLGFITFANYFTEAKDTVGGIISSIDAKILSKFETIAQQWARASRKVSLREWLTSRTVLLLSTDANRTGIERINRAIFERVSQLICDQPEGHMDDETWFFLDELPFAGNLPRLNELVSFGRTKGARVVITAQEIDGLYDVYGEHKTHTILGQCDNVAVLRVMSGKTREWASKFFGEYEHWETDFNQSRSSTQGTSHTSGQSPSTTHSKSRTWTFGTNTRRVKREAILPSEFSNFELPSPETGVHGFFCTPEFNAWRGPVPGEFLTKRMPTVEQRVPAFVPRTEPVTEPASTQASESKVEVKSSTNGATRKGRLPD